MRITGTEIAGIMVVTGFLFAFLLQWAYFTHKLEKSEARVIILQDRIDRPVNEAIYPLSNK